MKKLLTYYAFIVVNLMLIMGFVSASTIPQLASAVLFFPMAIYFWLLVTPHKKTALVIPGFDKKPTKVRKNINDDNAIDKANVTKIEEVDGEKRFDIDRRAFLKLVGSAGVTVFLFSIFTKRAHGAFFGSVPGPGIVGVKDSSGNQIDPAEEHPTDGYRLSDLDDSTPAYYGFTKNDGAWFIIQESSAGEFRYSSGASDYTNATTGWPNRTLLSYGYYDDVF
jgi:hypothetical protein